MRGVIAAGEVRLRRSPATSRPDEFTVFPPRLSVRQAPERRHAALRLRNVYTLPPVPRVQIGPLPARQVAHCIDLQCGPGDPKKEPVLDDAGDSLDGGGEVGRIVDRSGRAVEDDPTVVRDPRSRWLIAYHARLRGNANTRQPLCGLRPTEGDDLNWQRRARAELVDALFRGRHQQIVITREGDELLAEERAATALDGVERGIDLVGAVDA